MVVEGGQEVIEPREIDTRYRHVKAMEELPRWVLVQRVHGSSSELVLGLNSVANYRSLSSGVPFPRVLYWKPLNCEWRWPFVPLNFQHRKTVVDGLIDMQWYPHRPIHYDCLKTRARPVNYSGRVALL
jgi:hypothetical protein